jgi:fructose-1,6-bisphosphatase/inositol monophosphatase family enzyme
VHIDDVTEILREAAATEILPRFRALLDGDVSEKAPGELVTIADRAAEAMITRRLRSLIDVPVVGEEATADNPDLVRALRDAPAAWVVDPVDGTANFVAGSVDYAVMAALVRSGTTAAAWILHPATGRTYVAEAGSGAYRDGERLVRAPAGTDPAAWRGALFTRFLQPEARERAEASAKRFATIDAGSKCAGIDYARLIDGELEFIRYQRTMPWDHAPGSLLLTEAGGVTRRLDGSAYRPDDDRLGLLNASDAETWKTVLDIIS